MAGRAAFTQRGIFMNKGGKMSKHTINDLYQMQALPLSLKIRMTQRRIRDWVEYYGKDGVYVSFSGGKDSTALLHLAREIYLEITGVYVDTGLEYPEVKEFARRREKVEILRPKMNFRQVIMKYGYPFISKEVADLLGIDRREDKENGVETSEYFRMYNKERYKFFLDAPFEISAHCCSIMKKAPMKNYAKRTGEMPMTMQMASESRLRTMKWLENGCNGFEMKCPISNPMSFWTEQDVLAYLYCNHIPVASVYREMPAERMHGIPAIGINLHVEGTKRIQDSQVDILSGDEIDVGVIRLMPEFGGNPQVLEAVNAIIERFPEKEVIDY